MAGKVYSVRQSFNAGEVSKLVAFRDDVSKYASACLTLENAVPLVEGGAKKMPGTYFAGTTKLNNKSRLVPFQFSTTQGAILEFSEKVVRVWEGATAGSWSLGLALQVPNAFDFNPATAYNPGDVVLIGPYTQFKSTTGTPAGVLTISAPYGTSNASTVPITFSVSSIDTLQLYVTGSFPNQGILIALANATPAKNSAALIQAAIRALVSLNSPAQNFVDLTSWWVTPDATYFANPWILPPTAPHSIPPPPIHDSSWIWQSNGFIAEAVLANQLQQFPRQIFSNILSNPWNSTYWQQFNQGSEPPLEVVTPYLEADLFQLDCSTQSADILWIFHPNYPPAVIERFGPNLWKYSTSLPGQQPGEAPYRGTLDVVKTGYSALGQSITAITQANPCVVTVAGTNNVFAPGSRIYMNLIAGMVELNQGEFLIGTTSLGSGTFSFSLLDPNTGAAVDSTGYLKYVSGGFAVQVVALFAAAGDYPACGTLYQERLCVGGSLNNPTQINGSVQDDFPDFITDPNADDYAIQYTLVGKKLNQFINMIGTPNSLLIGTAGGVWVLTASTGQSISQTNIDASLQSSIGVSSLEPQLIGGSAVFVSRSARIVTFLSFNFVSNQWDNVDLTRLNRQITLGPSQTTSGLVQTAFQIEPYPIFWAVRNDGQLIGLVFNTQDQVYAWFRINMGAGLVESVAVISGENQEDQVVVVVNRLINGVTQRYVEYFMPQEIFSQLSNAFFVYSGQQLQLLGPVAITGISNANPTVVTAPNHGFSDGDYVQIQGVQGMTEINQDATEAYQITGVFSDQFQLVGMDSTTFGVYAGGGTVKQVTNAVTGLSYLLGQQVVAVGDGAIILQPTTVTSDSITFPYFANQITIGLPYQITIQPTNPVLSSQAATTRGMRQKLNRVSLSLYEAMGGNFGVDLQHMYPLDYGPGSQAQQPMMTTSLAINDLDCDWSDESTLYITQSDPLPFTLRGLVAYMNASQD